MAAAKKRLQMCPLEKSLRSLARVVHEFKGTLQCETQIR